jgi:hypothetical protein
VRPDTNRDLGSVRLVDSADIQQGKYAILSYVWGTSPSLRLTAATKACLVAGIPDDDLPPTIAHAVYVTRTLGIEYLWVDALCIIQDSDEDKKVEIPRMHRYYQEALVVISASAAPHVQSGFITSVPNATKRYDRALARDPLRNMTGQSSGIVPLRIPRYSSGRCTTLLADIMQPF